LGGSLVRISPSKGKGYKAEALRLRNVETGQVPGLCSALHAERKWDANAPTQWAMRREKPTATPTKDAGDG
jgi:hypothetical protein